jgi:nitrogen-specific signal transduction histidine kinase
MDITVEKEAEEKLLQAHEILMKMNSILEERVIERTSRIEHLLREKDTFIHQLGHDLKNPLGPLISLLPLLERNETDPEKKEMFQVINRNVWYMKNLVTKTLKLARLNSSKMTLNCSEMSFYDCVEEIIHQNKSAIQEKHLEVKNSISSDISIHADRFLICELVNNLVNNAIKYNRDHGWIHIDASTSEDVTTLSISDSGLGLSKEQIPHLFEVFYKVDESRHEFDSSGLGLSICKKIIELHGGRIWAESKGLNKGSTFHISFETKPVDVSAQGGTLPDITHNDRIQLLNHDGKTIIYLNYAYLKKDEYLSTLDEIRNYIAREGKKDMLLLTNVEGNDFSLEDLKSARKIGNEVSSFIHKNAIIGLGEKDNLFLKAVRLFSNINLKTFDDMDAAKEWLVKE